MTLFRRYLVLVLCAPGLSALAATLHVVAGAGGVSPDGSAERPFASPRDALEAASAVRARGESVTVVMHAGVYREERTLVIDTRLSGTAREPLIVKAAGDGPVIWSGAVPVPASSVRRVTDAETLARLPATIDKSLALFEIRAADIGLKSFPALNSRGFNHTPPGAPAWPVPVLDGRRSTLASYPNGEGYAKGFRPARIVSAGTDAKVIAGGATASQGGTVADRTMRLAVPPEKVALWHDAVERHGASLWLGGHWYWDWADDFLPVKSLDATGVATVGEFHKYGLGPHAMLHAYNLVEEMDVRGEYAIEPAKGRMLVLLAPDDVANLSVTLAEGPAVRLEGAAFVRFDNIRFADRRGEGVVIVGGRDTVFSRCEFRRTGGDAVLATGERLVFSDCVFSDIDGAGIVFDGGDRKTLTHADNLATHCLFEDFSRLRRTYTPAVSLSGVGSSVEFCLIRRAPHTAILFAGNEHRIVANDIAAVLSETGDCGAIYGGRDWTTHGTVISGNRIHDLGGVPGRWACGVYLDDMMSGITVKGNLLENMELGMLIGGGRHNAVTDNIIVSCKQGVSADTRGLGWSAKSVPGVMTDRLKAVPVASAAWKSRYPMVAETLKDRPGAPVGTRITGNAMVGCKSSWLNRDTGKGAAVLAPNFEKTPLSALLREESGVTVEGTPLTFAYPDAGPRAP